MVFGSYIIAINTARW